MRRIRTLVVDNEAMVRQSFVTVLSYQKDIEVVGQAKDGIECLECVRKFKPDVVLLDLVMPRQGGMPTIPMILETSPETKILIVSGYAQSELVYQSLKLGALGYLLKDSTTEDLMQAIRDVAKGEPSLNPSIALKMIQEMNHPTEVMYTTSPLTKREMDTLLCIARGLSNEEIAKELFVDSRTVAKYVSAILKKLHLASRTQAALYAIEEGLAPVGAKKR